MDERHALFELIRTRAFRQGETFRLASGRTSTIYFNLKPVMLHPQGARLIGRMLARLADERGAGTVGGLEMGAVPLVAATAAMSAEDARPVQAVFVRKAAKTHGTQKLIEGLTEIESLEGRRVLLVEDVTTTGGSALQAAAVLREAGAELRDVATIVDREEGAEAALAAEGLTLHALFAKSEFAAEA